jgi:hypothetical protein
VNRSFIQNHLESSIPTNTSITVLAVETDYGGQEGVADDREHDVTAVLCCPKLTLS